MRISRWHLSCFDQSIDKEMMMKKPLLPLLHGFSPFPFPRPLARQLRP
jgi:hypothetical protein